MRNPFGLVAPLVLPGLAIGSAEAESKWTTMEKDGRLEAYLGGQLKLGWQVEPLTQPVGGAKFAGSAFFHPLRTPGGFEWTTTQPHDHLHHFGLWWPWKMIEVDGVKYNTWEIQEGQGAHVAKSYRLVNPANGIGIGWEFINETVIKKDGGLVEAAIRETTQVTVSATDNTQILDISIEQKATGSPVTIVQYRYSGFSWRGPTSWKHDNSKMTTSAGKERNEANGTPAKWVMVSGPTEDGTATVLMMSAAATPEKLRVWDDKAHGGTPFVNFNPVMGKSLPLDDTNPEVSKRKYRVIAADYLMDASAAEAEWAKWLKS